LSYERVLAHGHYLGRQQPTGARPSSDRAPSVSRDFTRVSFGFGKDLAGNEALTKDRLRLSSDRPRTGTHKTKSDRSRVRSNSDDSNWFIALSIEQLALVTDHWLHGLSFR